MKKNLLILSFMMSFIAPANAELKENAVLMLLDKVTAVSREVVVPVGQSYAFEVLDIKVERCDKNPPEDFPESGAYLSISEIKKQDINIVFEGWMFASNPSINSFEHAVYDVWVKDCK